MPNSPPPPLAQGPLGAHLQNLDTLSVLSGLVLWREFVLISLKDVDGFVGGIRPTTIILDPCPSFLIKEARGGLQDWVYPIVNALFVTDYNQLYSSACRWSHIAL